MSCNPDSGDLNLFDCVILNPDAKEGKNTVQEVYKTPAVVVNTVVRNLFVLSGVLLFAAIILAGLKFAMGPTKAKEESKNIALSAGIGFLIMFSAYWIIQILEILTGIPNII